MLEPIQAESGVVVPPPGYLAAAQALCRRFGTLLILDEIQTGLGRTGTMWSYETEGFIPDILVIAKALSGGVAPIAATLTSHAIRAKAYGSTERFDLHSSTFAGNALGAAAGIATLHILHSEQLAQNGARLGQVLLEGLRTRLHGHPMVKSIRGRGLLVGIELGPTETGWLNRLTPGLVAQVSEKIFGQWAAFRLLERGLVCQPAAHHWNVLKLEPPLTITRAEIDWTLDTVVDLLNEYRDIPPLLKDVSLCVSGQWRRGWAFQDR